ncbi:GTPase IMAP family member 4-like [Parambassis ranga]|uniref:GTPase IMAP family member 4-like n=1 Tax=Parambassis ranga TaxID=210632 RepID=A0A6P7IZH0_9TELE|nr:GTPase IMAP family member 4-like [Parambassis ranga]XP_028269711.1 GTPase IMAP family member 4-like [Parambassis ranga]XP_028269718.1 GTPase IMAP family member 4-like [Parambassis ranga]
MGFTKAEDSRDSWSPVIYDLRIVLLGKTGSGKSETGNTILGQDAFAASLSPESVTKKCNKQTGYYDDRNVSVIDTPGIFDTSTDEEKLKKEIEECIRLSVPGPHIFLLVISLAGRFTKEEKNAVKWIKKNFGDEASKYTAVLFTRGDELNRKTIEDYLRESPDLKALIKDCGAGYVVFDNKCKENRTQVADLFEKIDKTVQQNGGYYTSSIYEEAQRQVRNEDWWRKCGDTLYSASNYLIGAAAATAGPLAVRAVMAEEAVVLAVRPMLMFAGAGVTRAIGRWLTPKKNDGPVPL